MLLPLLQNSTPDTIPYLIIGYAIIGGVGLLYVVSLIVRQRNLKNDLEVIARLHTEEE